ncbi:hypothetical protein [Chitinivibrio alkaliphilus]|uniref:Uncharacterized protein n=1 Tax=Chitinivibrio alkaliphilus ACht1 TaxID=1313304 RepID=U7D8C1_9BACT|nr:hypothetical protein [Chitinivibrio alkaliphilus]ERP32193.1 hypothetical protein CALK_0924 [Chitinivibrio alkaliphilus ACht1]
MDDSSTQAPTPSPHTPRAVSSLAEDGFSSEELPQDYADAQRMQDEAREMCGRHGSQATRLYLAALSFNKHNIDAWYGLLHCYEQHGMHEEAVRTRQTMREIFGEDVFDMEEIFSDYGDVEYLDVSGDAPRVTYYSQKGTEEDILREVHGLSRRLRSTVSGRSLTVYALTGADRSGYLLTVPLEEFPEDFRAFQREVTVTAVE